jgi:hypothetical protein
VIDKETLKKLQTERERLWIEVLEARRRAAKAEEEYQDALHKWYEQQR